MFPDHEVIKCTWANKYQLHLMPVIPTGIPRWAVLQYEAMTRMQQVIHFLVGRGKSGQPTESWVASLGTM